MSFNCDGIGQNKAEAAKYFEKAADFGNYDSMNLYALMLEHRDAVVQNKEIAEEYFKKSADH